jgi:hypothetical protein
MKSLSEMMDYEEFIEQRATNNHNSLFSSGTTAFFLTS